MPPYSYASRQLTQAVLQLAEPGPTVTYTVVQSAAPEPLAAEAALPVAPRCRQRLADPLVDEQKQQQRFLEMIRILNGGSYFGGAQKWVKTFGQLTDEHPFGDQVFRGMATIWKDYTYRYQVEQYVTVFVGWFLVPRPFSKKQAAKAAEEDDQFLQPYRYPAIFAQTGYKQQLIMVCLNLLVENSKPWWVHCSRVHSMCELRQLTFN